MAIWRTKAYSVFGLKQGDYSYKSGMRDLFADLVSWARSANRDNNHELLGKIVAYVTWAARQNSDELVSVVDLAFFMPVFRDSALSSQLQQHFSQDLFAEKRQLLLDELPD
jgi:hypothetical protein